MTETMVERLAKVMHEKMCEQDIHGYLAANFDLHQVARATIEAMRAITEDMETAAVDAVPLLEGKEARWSWEAMIGAALKE